MKPDTTAAMRILIGKIRDRIPVETPIEKLCTGPCTGCAKKLLEFLDMELCHYESTLMKGVKPKLGDIDKLARAATKISAT